MEKWITKNIEQLTGHRAEEADIDRHLSEIRGHSLRMVTFLARFNREFGCCPKIMDFIECPTLQTLTRSVQQSVSV